jgi:hypothetical protein
MTRLEDFTANQLAHLTDTRNADVALDLLRSDAHGTVTPRRRWHFPSPDLDEQALEIFRRPSTAAEQSVLLKTCLDAIAYGKPEALQDFLAAHREHPRFLDPVMKTVAEELDKKGIVLRYNGDGSHLGFDGRMHLLGELTIYTKAGGPVLELMTDAREPAVEGYVTANPNGTNSFHDYPPARDPDDWNRLALQRVQDAFSSYAKLLNNRQETDGQPSDGRIWRLNSLLMDK